MKLEATKAKCDACGTIGRGRSVDCWTKCGRRSPERHHGTLFPDCVRRRRLLGTAKFLAISLLLAGVAIVVLGYVLGFAPSVFSEPMHGYRWWATAGPDRHVHTVSADQERTQVAVFVLVLVLVCSVAILVMSILSILAFADAALYYRRAAAMTLYCAQFRFGSDYCYYSSSERALPRSCDGLALRFYVRMFDFLLGWNT